MKCADLPLETKLAVVCCRRKWIVIDLKTYKNKTMYDKVGVDFTIRVV